MQADSVPHDMRARLRQLQIDVDEIRSAHQRHRVPAGVIARWHEETYFTSFARSRVVAFFAILYAGVSLALHPKMQALLLHGENSALWLWPSLVRLALIFGSLAILFFGVLVYRKRHSLPLKRFAVAVKLYVLLIVLCAATDVAVYPGVIPDLTSFAVSMCLAAVVLVTPGYYRIPLYPMAAAIAFFGWWFMRGVNGHLYNIGIYAGMIAGLCIALDRLTHRQRVGSLLSLKRAELQEAIARELLDNTLPKPISRELAQHEGAIAQHYDIAMVLFADLVGFTELASKMTPDALLTMLDDVFKRFDILVLHHDMEKIKTIGDAYMAAGGLTQSQHCDADKAIQLGVAMHKALAEFNQQHQVSLALRIGIHCGPVVAGVIGTWPCAHQPGNAAKATRKKRGDLAWRNHHERPGLKRNLVGINYSQ
jgi:Adenylate and Guanylate cyclase catalytic domain